VPRGKDRRARQQVARASGRSVEQATQRALAELDFAPGELADDQYEVTIVIPPEEGFMGVGAVDAVVEVALVGEDFDDFYGPEKDAQPAGLPDDGYEDDDEDDDSGQGSMGGWDGPYTGSEEDMDPDKPVATRLRYFVERVLWGMGLKAQVRVAEGNEEILVDISGDDLGILIGRRGQTLDALEYLAGIAAFPGGAARKHVEVDAEGYKDRRRKQIERVALRKAEEVVKRGRPAQLNPMTSAERKIVHLVLRERNDVTTVSEGREPNRAVVISPVR
jgi:spoIIIJ-associated protein